MIWPNQWWTTFILSRLCQSFILCRNLWAGEERKSHLLILTIAMAQWRISVLTICHIYNEVLDWTISTDNVTRMTQLHILNWCPWLNPWCQAATLLHQKSWSLCITKPLICAFFPVRLKLLNGFLQKQTVKLRVLRILLFGLR